MDALIACLAFGVDVPIDVIVDDDSIPTRTIVLTHKEMLAAAQAEFRKGDPALLRSLCESDVRMTAGLYERVRGR
jgi:hypothetical protein